MKKKYVVISSIIYILAMTLITYITLPDLTKDIFRGNLIIIIGASLFLNMIFLYINVSVMAYFLKVSYKISTKNKITCEKSLTFKLLLPIFFTHGLILLVGALLDIKNAYLIWLFLNPIIYWFQIKQFREIDTLKRKIIILIPIYIYIILDVISVAYYAY